MLSMKERALFGIIVILAAILAALFILPAWTQEVRLVTTPSGGGVYAPVGQSFNVTCQGLGDDASKFSNMRWLNTRGIVIPQRAPGVRKVEENSLQLLFTDPESEESGIYKCAALYNNKETLETSVRITFYSSKPTFEYLYEKISAEEGSKLEIKCSALGESPISYEWYKYEDKISGDVNSAVFFINYESSSSLVIPKVDKSHEGSYSCMASNRHGMSSKVYELTVDPSDGSGNETEEDLSSILHLNIVNRTSNSVEFAMNFSGTVTAIEVKYMDKVEKVQLFTNWKYGDKYEVKGLIPAGLYTFRFRTLPSDNNTWSRSYQVTPLPDKPEIIFQNVEGGNVKLEWLRKTDDLKRETIDSYELKYFYVSMQEGGNEWKPGTCAITIQIPSCSGGGYTIADLPRRSYYEIQLRAHTVSGYGEPSTQKIFFP